MFEEEKATFEIQGNENRSDFLSVKIVAAV